MEQKTNENLQPNEPEKKIGDGVNPLAIISYIGPLCLIPFLTKEKDEFVKFHAKQGLVLLAFEVIIWVVIKLLPPILFWYIWQLMNIVYLVAIVFSIIGIVNVVHKEKKQLPLIGSLANNIKL